ncbi:MAG TPA: MMPL family transporter [Ktedonobacterales bacterium]|nr:MMPL family transporter [Ktedonobacterales bacterium]
MLARFGGMLYRTRWVVLCVALLVTAAAAAYGFGVFGALQGTTIVDPTSESAHAEALLASQLNKGSTDIGVLLSSKTLRATDPAFEQAATSLVQKLEALPEVASVTSYYSSHTPGLLSRDGRETLVLVELSAQGGKQANYNMVAPQITSPTLQVALGGSFTSDQQFNEQVGADLAHAETITLPLVAILLVLIFQGLVAAGLPLLIGGVAIVGSFALLRVVTGFMGVSSFAINVVTFMGLGLAIDYSLFMVSRFREEVAAPEADVRAALQRTMQTAGRTILFSGLTVGTSLIALLLFPEVFLRSMGLGAMAATLVAGLSALSILPALLAILGRRVNALSFQQLVRRLRPVRRVPAAVPEQGIWYRLAQMVMRFPVPVAVVTIGLLVLLGTPFLHASFSSPDEQLLPPDRSARVVFDQLQQNFPQESGEGIPVAITMTGNALAPANLARLDGYVRQIETIPGVLTVQSLVTVDPQLSLAEYQRLYANPAANPQLATAAAVYANGNATKVIVDTNVLERSSAATQIVSQIRALQAPPGFMALVGGATAEQVDLFASLRATIPWALLVMAGAVLVLLFLLTGSMVLPLKALLLNILSLSATFGALVWVFQDGHLQSLLGFQSGGSLDSTQPVLIFGLAFGLSMDYEVFLLSRIKEQFDLTGDNRAAVALGLQRVGGLITSAALLLAVVVGAFVTAKIIFIQEIGLGVALAVLMDATVVRGLLLPALMRLLGQWNWWAPSPLRAWQRRIALGEATAPALPEEPALSA